MSGYANKLGAISSCYRRGHALSNASTRIVRRCRMHCKRQAMPARRIGAVALFACLIAVCSGCARLPRVANPSPAIPPASLYAGCPVPSLAGDTVAAVIEEYVPRLIARLRRCDADMRAIQRWANEVSR